MGRQRMYDDYDEDNPFYNDDDDYYERDDEEENEDDNEFDEEDQVEDDEDEIDDSIQDEFLPKLIESIKEDDFESVKDIVENTSVELRGLVLTAALKYSSDSNIFCWLLDESSKSSEFEGDEWDFDELLKKFSERCIKEQLDNGHIVEVVERCLLHGGTTEGAVKTRLAKYLDDQERRHIRELEQVTTKIRDVLDKADLDFSSTFAKKCVENQSIFDMLLRKEDVSYEQLTKLIEKKSSSKKL